MRDPDQTDAFEFKPITEGLGFHRKTAQAKPLPTKKPPTLNRLRPLPTVPRANLKQELQSEKMIETSQSKSLVTPEKQVDPWWDLLAGGLDLIFICSSLIMIVSTSFYLGVLELPINTLMIPLSCLFIFLGLFYFILFDYFGSGSPGKQLLGLRLKQKNSQRVTLGQVVSRFLLSFFSTLAFCVPKLLNFHGFLTDTVLVRSDTSNV